MLVSLLQNEVKCLLLQEALPQLFRPLALSSLYSCNTMQLPLECILLFHKYLRFLSTTFKEKPVSYCFFISMPNTAADK